MTNQNAYEKLYNEMKTQFTVKSNEGEYTLGDFMYMKANSTKKDTKNLPAKRNNAENRSVAAVFSHVNEMLTVKKPPVKDQTIKAFPIRTSAAAFLSAIVACALIFSFGIISTRSNKAITAEEVPAAYEADISENTEN